MGNGENARIWTSIGSAGALSATDLTKVTFDNAVVSLGHDLAPPIDSASEDPSVTFPNASAVVRYNITPVDGLFLPSGVHFQWMLQFCYRGTVRARLVQVALNSGAEITLLHFDSASFAPADTLVMNYSTTSDDSPVDSPVMDFVNFAYYVEATLTASAIVVGNPAQIAVVKVVASVPFH
jgi:hypothetical protein